MENDATRTSWLRRRNWWKIAFFTLLIIFEFSRELAILSIADHAEPKISARGSVIDGGSVVVATGQWVRIDGGGPLMPGATRIECDQTRLECLEANANLFNGYLAGPYVDRYIATFTAEAINYENESPGCVRYRVRIDLKLTRVFAVRERKEGSGSDVCNYLERRVEMSLGDGYVSRAGLLADHWVPFIDGAVVVFKALRF